MACEDYFTIFDLHYSLYFEMSDSIKGSYVSMVKSISHMWSLEKKGLFLDKLKDCECNSYTYEITDTD